MDYYKLCISLEDNNRDEHEAISNYFALLEVIEQFSTKTPRIKELKAAVEEIISEEMKHRIILDEFSEFYSDIKPEQD